MKAPPYKCGICGKKLEYMDQHLLACVSEGVGELLRYIKPKQPLLAKNQNRKRA